MPDAPKVAAEEAAVLERNAVNSLPGGALAAKLQIAREQGRPLRVKLGIDPTAPDIHLGHAVVLGKLRELQDAGHRVVLIVGDYTARVGDPSGRSSLRPMLSEAEIDANAQTFREQALKILDPDPERLEVRRNGEWLDMALTDLLKLVRTTTVAQLLEREDFAKRMSANEPVSMLELLYPLLQGYDSVATCADVELGGTDQKFNLLLGREIQRAYGTPAQAILTMPILVGTDGHQKMSKSLGNQIGVTERAGGDVRQDDGASPTRRWAEYYRLLLHRGGHRSATSRARCNPARPSARWRAGSWPGCTPRAGWDGAGRAGMRPGGTSGPRRPSRSRRRASAQERGRAGAPARRDRGTRSGSLARRPGGLIDQGAATLGDEPLGKGEHDVSVERGDGAVLKLGKRRFRRLRAG